MDSDFQPQAGNSQTYHPPTAHPESANHPVQHPSEIVPPAGYTQRDQPVAVVKVLSVRGLEYLMMSLALWAGAFSLAGTALSLLNGGTSSDVLAFPASVLIVSVGLFTWFFLRLKKAELQDTQLRFDPSKRRLSQITQIFSYIAVFVSLVGIIYSCISAASGNLSSSLWKIIVDFAIVIVVAGGILAYYWHDEHKVR